MPPSSAPPVIDDVEQLAEPFLSTVRDIMSTIDGDGLPLRVFETRRSLARQAWLFSRGVTRASGANGPHCWGLAVDIILVPKHEFWSLHHIGADQRPQKVNGGGAEWDTGAELRGGSCVVVRPHVTDVVRRLGAIAEFHGATWGGRNEGPWRSSRPFDPFGWDAFHIQMRGWAKYVESGKVPAPR